MAKTQKFLLVTMGPGETSQAFAFGTYLEKQGVEPIYCLQYPENISFLGLIPGVGALYNAQYKKAAIQMLIFATLSALGRAMDAARFSSLESFFGFLMFGFYAYMVFDSYHTAKSRHRQS